MVTKKEVIDQLKKIEFKHDGWGRSEVSELPHILLPDEEIYQCVNGYYDGGFALLVATNIRVLLIDKKPLNYLTVEDMRFDMISEMDYNHRMIGADISISSGGKNLHFRSYNKTKLRELIGHVQHCMAESKKKQDVHQEGQIQHLEQINKQLQAYLLAQQQYQMQVGSGGADEKKPDKAVVPEPPKPSHELADFLYAQSLLAQHKKQVTDDSDQEANKIIAENSLANTEDNPTLTTSTDNQMQDMYKEALKEIYNSRGLAARQIVSQANDTDDVVFQQQTHEINPILIAYSKLPFLLRNRRFNQDSFNSNVKATEPSPS